MSAPSLPLYRFIAFSKPWTSPLAETGARLAALGFDGLELPVRPGYPVTPDNLAAELPRAVRLLRDEFGLSVESVAGPTTPAAIEACSAAGVSVIRICPGLLPGEAYPDGETRLRREWEALTPYLESAGVTLGVQNHSGRFVPVNALGLARLLAPFDPRHVAAVWDAAHEALEGTEPEMALDVLPAASLRMVNLKNGYKTRREPKENEDAAAFRTVWVGGREGICSWRRVAADIVRRGWRGVVCLTAEYSEPDLPARERLLAADLVYARALFAAAE